MESIEILKKIMEYIEENEGYHIVIMELDSSEYEFALTITSTKGMNPDEGESTWNIFFDKDGKPVR